MRYLTNYSIAANIVVDSTVDAYGLARAVYGYSILWDIFVETNLVLFPVIALIFSAIKDQHEGGPRMKAQLRRVQTELALVFLALTFAMYPMVQLNIDSIKYYKRQCTSAETGSGEITTEILGEESKFIAENMSVQLGGRDIMIPPLLDLVLAIGQGLKNWAVQELPCSTDIRLISDGMRNQRIADESLKKETANFIKWCFNPGRQKWLSFNREGLTDDQNWPGSRKLLLDKGYYDNFEGDGFYSREALPGFEATLNKIPESAELPPDYGFPTCKEWWLGPGVVNTPYVHDAALSTRLFNSIEKWLRDKEVEVYDTTVTKLNRVKDRNYEVLAMKDVIVKDSLFTPIKLTQLSSLSTSDYGMQGDSSVTDYLFRGFATVGVAMNSVQQYSGASMLQLMMPMVKPFVLMIIFITYVPAMVFSGYQWKYIGLYCGVVMSIMFWPFFWELSRLIDDTLLTAMGISLTEVNTQMLSQYIASGLYLYAPVLFSTALGWVGLVSADGIMNKMASPAGSAGNAGGALAQKEITGGIKKGIGAVTGGPAGAAAASAKGKE